MPINFAQLHQYALNLYGISKTVNAFVLANEHAVAVACGSNELYVLGNAVNTLDAQACVMLSTVTNVADFFSCQNWNPLYTTVAFDAICYEGNQGFFWISFSQFMIVLCSMVMLTLRIAFAPLISDDQVATSRRCCCRRREIEMKRVVDAEQEKDDLVGKEGALSRSPGAPNDKDDNGFVTAHASADGPGDSDVITTQVGNDLAKEEHHHHSNDIDKT